jgi:putative acetyltransferase
MIRRVASESDLSHLHRLFGEYESSLEPDLRHGEVPSLERLRRMFAEPSAAFLAVRGDEPIGCVAVVHFDASSALLRHLYVSKRHRGLGAARALVGAVIDYARDGGFRRVILDTAKERLQAAYQLYVKIGFRECAPYREVGYHPATFMELPIA